MSNELAVIESKSLTLPEVMQVGKVMAESGFFQDSRGAAQAIVKILAGQEMGFGPFASMTGIHLIQGRPAVGANLLAGAVKGSSRYDYRIATMTDQVCEIIFFERGEEIGRSKFTTEDARKAGTKNMDKFPRNMLFARAMSNGVKWYCPNVTNGAPVYTPEELGADVNEEGEVIQGSYTIPDPQPEPAKPQKPNGNGSIFISQDSAEYQEFISLGGQIYGDDWDNKRGELVYAVTKSTRNSLQMTPDHLGKLMKGLRDKAGKMKVEQEPLFGDQSVSAQDTTYTD